MKKIILASVCAVMLMLVYMNITMFVRANTMTNELASFATKTKEIKHENELLEQKLYEANSLQKTASAAADLEFTAHVDPIYIDAIRVAKK
jgi:cell division protein FtsL